MAMAEKWNRIVEQYMKLIDAPEQTVQGVWERIFAELLGYSSFGGEIERHRSIRIGSTERVITDIIIKDGSTDLFVAELKQHNFPFEKGMEGQLLSYLKQLRVNTGILICNKIYIYDYDYNKDDDDQDRAEIEFKQDNPDGLKFIEMFSKNTFSKASVKEFVRKQNEFVKNVGLIKKELVSDLAISLLRVYFADKYGEAEFEQAIKGVNIAMTPKGDTIERSTKPPVSQPVPTRGEGDTLSRTEAVMICKRNGVSIDSKYTLSKRNKSNPFYWSNPSITCLSQDWYLLLNDHRNNELHVFKVPANSLSADKLRFRKDKPNTIDLNIRCDDNTFEDSRSKVCFATWHKKTIQY
ncbi:MAG: hypothetical protein LBI19_10075 [Oscillospiraceae bacterium]|jgi:hypothetical protein|nr:hypothetical protein [Oscillospiraceae bacterium]